MREAAIRKYAWFTGHPGQGFFFEYIRFMDHHQNIEIKFDELLKVLEQHLVPDHYPRNDLNEVLPLSAYKPLFGKRVIEEGQFIISEDNHYEVWYAERGAARKILESKNMDEVLYVLFEGITQTIATSYEARNRNPNTKDSRCDWLPIQEELMGHLSQEWREKLHRKICEVFRT